jgi:hypothetical protein
MSWKPKAISREQRNLWRKLNEYIRQEGGWTVSQPDCSPIRFESALDSELPELLRQAGHRVIDYGRHERLLPTVVTETRGSTKISRQQVGVGIVGVWQFDLPSLTKPSTV